jgi:membrane carboxypeptidase/penicillin-binding protein
VLSNADAAIPAEAGGRRVYKDHAARNSDYNRATDSLRQPGSAWKPLVYLAAFREGLNLDSNVLDVPIALPMGGDRGVKWIANYDNRFKGAIPMRLALAESRNAVAVSIAREIGLEKVFQTARELGIRTPLQPYITTALGASEVRLLELAGAYRAMASGVSADPHVLDRVVDAAGGLLYEAPRTGRKISSAGLSLIQEGLRGVIRLPSGTGHSLDRSDFPIPVMGKTGTTSDFRDALFVRSTYGLQGITVAVRIGGFDDNRALGRRRPEVGPADLPRDHAPRLQGPAGRAGAAVPPEIEEGIDEYLAMQDVLKRIPPSRLRFRTRRSKRSAARRPQSSLMVYLGTERNQASTGSDAELFFNPFHLKQPTGLVSGCSSLAARKKTAEERHDATR